MDLERLLSQVAEASEQVRHHEGDLVARSRQLLRETTPNCLGVSDFIHLNPSLPNREISGLLRLTCINDRLRLAGTSGEIQCFAYDTPLPINEARAEKGGIGFYVGLRSRTIQIIELVASPYADQACMSLDIDSVLDHCTVNLRRALPDHHRVGDVMAELRQMLLVYQRALGTSRTAATQLAYFKQEVYSWVAGMDFSITPLSSERGSLASVLAGLEEEGIDWWQLPTSSGRLFRWFTLEGKPHGAVFRNDGGLIHQFDGGSQTLSPEDTRELIRAGRLHPSVELYLLAFVVAPAWLHFGNTYGGAERVWRWLQQAGGEHPKFVSIGGDGNNSIPLGDTLCPTRSGRRLRALLAVDLVARGRHVVRKAANVVANTGLPAWEAEDMYSVLARRMSDS
jgi:hypothetical protein